MCMRMCMRGQVPRLEHVNLITQWGWVRPHIHKRGVVVVMPAMLKVRLRLRLRLRASVRARVRARVRVRGEGRRQLETPSADAVR